MGNDKENIKKVALCLSGQPRSFAEAYPYIKKNIIDCNPNVDVFIHCWYDEKEAGKKFSNTSDSVREGGINIVEENVPNQLKELYQPKLYAFEPQEDFSNQIKPEYMMARDKVQPFATFSMWTSILKCNELKKQHETENNFTYDIVIKGRFDLALTLPLIVDELEYPNQIITMGPLPSSDYTADILFYSSSKNMDTIATLVNNLEKYFFSIKRWSNEIFLYHHLTQHNLVAIHLPELTFHLVRGKRNISDTIWYYSRRIKQKLFK